MIFRLLRFFSITSLISIVVTAVLLTLFYRQVATQLTLQLSESNNLALAQTLLTTVQPELDDYLASVRAVDPREQVTQAPSERVIDLFQKVMRQSTVVRIKLYNERGVVVFSTNPVQIGDNQVNNSGFRLAGNGRVASGLAYRNAVNRFDGETESDNLMQTYVPVRAGPNGPIRGVFEIYTQANPLISQNRLTVFVVLAGVGLILLFHYAVLILVVRRAKNVIESQQHTIRERTATLEKLSAEMLAAEEAEKQRLAAGLHEGIAQTLSAIKMRIEENFERVAASKANGASLKSTVPELQAAIGEIRSLAMELRPSSLDDLGLLPTIDWFCGELEHRHPEILIEREISVREDEVPGPLKIVIYRVIESAIRILSHAANTDRIQLALRRPDQTIILTIDAIPHDSTHDTDAPDSATADPRFAAVQERTTLSGGTFSATRKAEATTLRAAWTV